VTDVKPAGAGIVIAAIALLAGCGSGLSSGSSGSAKNTVDIPNWSTTTFRGFGLEVTFEHPAGWRVRAPGVMPVPLLGLLADFPVHNPCRETQRGRGHFPQVHTCPPAALGTFPPDGVLVLINAYSVAAGLSEGAALGDGIHTSVDGHPARELVANPRIPNLAGTCYGVGADRTINYRLLDGQIQGVLNVQFCLRGPNFALLDKQVGQAMEAIRIRISRTSPQMVIDATGVTVTGGAEEQLPACHPNQIEVSLLPSGSVSNGSPEVRFTTTIRARGSANCGLPELQTCADYPTVTVFDPGGSAVWQWSPPQSFAVCSPLRQSLPMSITSDELVVPPGALAPGRYTASAEVLSRTATASFDLP
jgi:hypothetical protein